MAAITNITGQLKKLVLLIPYRFSSKPIWERNWGLGNWLNQVHLTQVMMLVIIDVAENTVD